MEAASGSGWRARAGMVGAPLVFVALWFAPLPLDLPADQAQSAHRLAAVFGAILVAWLTEVIPIAVTALLIAPLLVVADIAPAADAFKYYADPLLYLFVGGFFIAEAMSHHGLDRRMAKAIVGSSWVAAIPSRVRIALMLAGALLSMWISNTAATAILVPILLKMLRRRAGQDHAATGGLLALAFACSAGGLGTLVGSPPNLITVRLLANAGTTIGFLDWMKVGLPAAVLISVAVWIVVGRFHPTTEATASAAAPDEDPFEAVPEAWSRGEIVTAIAFGLAVVGWVLPGVSRALELEAAEEIKRLMHPGVVAILASSILFMVPRGDGERVLSWKQAAQIDWGIILLFGGGIALGTQLVDTGLASAMSRGFVALSGIHSLWALTAVACVFTIFFTEVCSNTASANMLVPLVIGIAAELHVSPVPPALAVGLAASCAFMLPIATGPNAIAYSTGRVSQIQMMKSGLVLNVVCAILVFALVRVLCPLYGWT
ncbi:MAG: SLC13/DASS family transporter [Sandaracinaceae bacterium]|nr:SLC13/DASS family transporter [Sandaracinaceae bacterium]